MISNRIIDDYYAEENKYPYPPKDIQLIILRYAAMLDRKTCKNIRLVRKCFEKDVNIRTTWKFWYENFEHPLYCFNEIKKAIKKYNNMSYAESVVWAWDLKWGNKFFNYKYPTVILKYAYCVGNDVHTSSGVVFNDIKLFEVCPKKHEIAILLSPLDGSSSDGSYSDVLLFIYLDWRVISNGYLHNDVLIASVNKIDNTKKLEEIEQGVVKFNSFEKSTIEKHLMVEEKKMKKYNGMSVCFAYLKPNAPIFHPYSFSPYYKNRYRIELDEIFPIPHIAHLKIGQSFTMRDYFNYAWI
jgi:hypothetical protein